MATSKQLIESRLLLPIGPPYSGKHLIAEYLHDAGLLDHLLDLDAEPDGSTHSARVPHASNLVSGRVSSYEYAVEIRMRVNERSLLLCSFLDGAELFDLMALAAHYADTTCLILMRYDVDLALERLASDPNPMCEPQVLIDAYKRIENIDLENLGIPYVHWDTLALALSGRDY